MFKKSKQAPRPDDSPPGDENPAALAAPSAESVADFSYGEDADDELTAVSSEETARYIADMVGALAAMAGRAKLDLLTYLLNMARVEAELQARQTETEDDASQD
jgi:hypothetical protein